MAENFSGILSWLSLLRGQEYNLQEDGPHPHFLKTLHTWKFSCIKDFQWLLHKLSSYSAARSPSSSGPPRLERREKAFSHQAISQGLGCKPVRKGYHLTPSAPPVAQRSLALTLDSSSRIKNHFRNEELTPRGFKGVLRGHRYSNDDLQDLHPDSWSLGAHIPTQTQHFLSWGPQPVNGSSIDFSQGANLVHQYEQRSQLSVNMRQGFGWLRFPLPTRFQVWF